MIVYQTIGIPLEIEVALYRLRWVLLFTMNKIKKIIIRVKLIFSIMSSFLRNYQPRLKYLLLCWCSLKREFFYPAFKISKYYMFIMHKKLYCFSSQSRLLSVDYFGWLFSNLYSGTKCLKHTIAIILLILFLAICYF